MAPRFLVLSVLLALFFGAGCSSSDDQAGEQPGLSAEPEKAETRAVPQVVDFRPLTTRDGRIVDDMNRQVLLRGVNLNSLGEYWQGDPDHPPVAPVTDADWDEMAASGFNVVRLIVTWSLIEPVRGEIDQDYLDTVDEAVTGAAERGIYSVIDMHQDAYSAYISTDDPAQCPEGTSPAKGWDGAPEWAVITDGANTCVRNDPGVSGRNSSPAVLNAWNHFWDDTDGIRTRFVASWRAVAERFAGRPEVAGYNILNEPETSRPSSELTPLYEEMLAAVAGEIRAAEADSEFEHLLIVEPALPSADVSFGLVIPDPQRMGIDPRNVVAGPHNYSESISGGLDISIEATDDLYVQIASGLGLPVWVGEQGWWDVSEETLAKVARAAASQDRLVLGGAWWQWRQTCGDPHSVPWGGWGDDPAGEAGESIHLHGFACPGDVDLGRTEEFFKVVSRGYPRAAPGRVTELTSDPETGDLMVAGEGGDPGASLVVWTPTDGSAHQLSIEGLGEPVVHVVAGGRIIVATVDGAGPYRLTLS